MSTDDDPILAALSKLAGKVDAAPVMLWGTVTQSSPLMVTLDGAIDPSGAPVAVPAQSAVGPVAVGQRVWCVRQSRRVIVTSVPAPFPRMAAGRVRFTMSGPSTVGITVTLPAGRFTQPPVPVPNLETGIANSQLDVVRIYNSSTTALTLGIWTGDGSSMPSHEVVVGWHAIQMTDGSAEG